MTQKELSLTLHRIMARTRALVEVLILNRQDLFGAFLTGLRQEAVAAGVIGAYIDLGLARSSPKNGCHRTTWGLAVGLDEITESHNHAFEIMKNHLSKATAANHGRDSNIHWGCLPCMLLPFLCSDMGRLYPVLVGMSEEIARRSDWRALPVRERPVGVAFFGEGADQQGVIHETNTWVAASNYKCIAKEAERIKKFYTDDAVFQTTRVARGSPVFHVVVENQYSIFTDPADEHGRSDLALRARGYGDMAGILIDGDDVEAMCSAARGAIFRGQELTATRIVARTFRGTGHNEDMDKRNPFVLEDARHAFLRGEWGHNIDWSDGEIQGVDPIEFKEAWKRDPLLVHREKLVKAGLASGEDLNAMLFRAREEMWELYQRAKAEPDITPEENRKDHVVIPPFSHERSVPEEKPAIVTKTRRLGYNEAYVEMLRELLEKDSRVTFFGQDVRTGGVLVPTRKLAEQFGPLRVFNTPIVEEATHSNAAGRSLVGGRPIVEVQQFAPFFADAFPSMLSVVAHNYYQKEIEFPFINIFHCGIVRSGGSGMYHESWPEGFIQPMQGIVIVAPANAYDLIGLMRAAHEYNGPVAMLLQTAAANEPEFASDIPEEQYCIPLGKAKVRRQGKDFTVIAYGAACVSAALNEAEALAEEHISVEVIDMRTVWPFDLDTMRESIRKTGRYTVMYEERRSSGIAAELILQLQEHEEGVLPYTNMIRMVRIAADNVPIPSAKSLVWDRLPYVVVDVNVKDDKGRAIKRATHRSPKLAAMIKQSLT